MPRLTVPTWHGQGASHVAHYDHIYKFLPFIVLVKDLECELNTQDQQNKDKLLTVYR